MNVNASKEDHETPLITTNSCRSQSPIADKEDRPRRGCLQRWRYGWKITLSLASASCVVVLAFNLGFVSWAAARHRVHGDQGVLYEGECDHVRHLSTGIHLLINILGTILLGASNYCMQCLCAPTRRDIDKAHAKGNWLDVGVPSFRNLLYVSRLRSFMWIVLVLSSFPLHLVYNSTIFSTTAAYSYMIFAGPDPTGQSGQPNITANGFSDEAQASLRQFYSDARNGSIEFEHMDGSECINAYATTYQTKYGDVLLIPPTDNGTNQYAVVDSQSVFDPPSYIPGSLVGDPFQWLCPSGSNKSCSSYVPSIQSQADQGNWVVHVDSGEYRANSCLVRKVPQLCKLQYSLALTITVIVANVIKGAIMLYMAITSAEPPMLTTGDAVSSFLHQPDNVTQRKCLVGQNKFQVGNRCPLHDEPADYEYGPLVYRAKPKRWYSAVSWVRWCIIFSIWHTTAFAFIVLLLLGVQSDGGAAWAAELGAISAQALIRDGGWPTSIVANTIIANTPQLIFSALYFCFNSVLTSMTSAAEWSRFGLSRRGLRVSWNPQGSQRSSYFLSLPYRYAIPLMSCSALLHWLISQSLFLVGIDAYKVGYGRTPERDVMTCGYTPRAIISGIGIGIFMLICLIAVSCKKLASGMPVAGSCTFAISAACHPTYNPNNEASKPADPLEGIEFMPLKWGAVPVDGPVGHCAFSERTVEMPQDRNLYQ